MRINRAAPAAAIAAGLVLLAACGGTDGSGDDAAASNAAGDDATEAEGEISGSVNMWIYPVIPDEAAHRAFWDETIAAFNEEYPGVSVAVEIFPWADRDQALTTAIAGNSAPDVVYLIPDQLPGYSGSIEPLDDYLTDEERADFRDNAIGAVTIDGRMLGAPVLQSAVPLVCNRQVFEDVGQDQYPETWADLLAMAPDFAAAGYAMTSYGGDVANSLNLSFYPLLWQAGGEVFTEDGTAVAFNSPAGVKALEFVAELVENEYVDGDRLTTEPPLEQTRLAQAEVACVWHIEPQFLVDFWGEENIVVLPPLTETEQVAYGTVASLVMLSGAEDKEAVGRWIAFVTEADRAAEYSTSAGYFPVSESAGTKYDGDPILGEVEKYVGLTTVGSLHEKSREVMGVLAPEIQAVLIGQKTPQQALDDAAAAAEVLL